MAIEILMPTLGATMKSGTILEWFIKEGEEVVEGEPLLEIMTDKIEMEVEAISSGVLLKKLYDTDVEVGVNEVIAYIGEKGEDFPENPSLESGATDVLIEENQKSPLPLGVTVENNLENPKKLRRTPAALKLAKERNVDVHSVTGSGPKGRIHLVDVKKYIKETNDILKTTPLANKIANHHQINLSTIKGTGANGKVVSEDVKNKIHEQSHSQKPNIAQETIPMQGIRKIVAKRMVESAFTAPHVTLTSEIDMSQSIELRGQLLPIIEKQINKRISYTEIIMKAVAYTLRKHPMINVSLHEDEIIIHPHINIGLAVAVANGLVVPVVKGADQKGLAELTDSCKHLGSLAREGKLKSEFMSGGTFTISNLGMYDIDAFTPIINQPEAAILGVGRIHDKPVAIDGALEVRPMMAVSLSFDHRIVDGAPAAAFLTDLKSLLEHPFHLLV